MWGANLHFTIRLHGVILTQTKTTLPFNTTYKFLTGIFRVQFARSVPAFYCVHTLLTSSAQAAPYHVTVPRLKQQEATCPQAIGSSSYFTAFTSHNNASKVQRVYHKQPNVVPHTLLHLSLKIFTTNKHLTSKQYHTDMLPQSYRTP
jgi:hypothetical protein